MKVPHLVTVIAFVTASLVTAALVPSPATRAAVLITPNSPYQVGLNAVVVSGAGSAAQATAAVEAESGLQASTFWIFGNGSWRFYLPDAPLIDGGLSEFPGPVAAAFVVLEPSESSPPPESQPLPRPTPSPTPSTVPSQTARPWGIRLNECLAMWNELGAWEGVAVLAHLANTPDVQAEQQIELWLQSIAEAECDGSGQKAGMEAGAFADCGNVAYLLQSWQSTNQLALLSGYTSIAATQAITELTAFSNVACQV